IKEKFIPSRKDFTAQDDPVGNWTGYACAPYERGPHKPLSFVLILEVFRVGTVLAGETKGTEISTLMVSFQDSKSNDRRLHTIERVHLPAIGRGLPPSDGNRIATDISGYHSGPRAL